MRNATNVTPTKTKLKRAVNLPLLVFYGLGVTVGAGIFALTGEITKIAGDHAPLAFLVAGLIATTSAISYALMTNRYPRAAGEAYFVSLGLGRWWGIAVGAGILLTAVTSSSAISLAFASYLGTVVALPKPFLIAAMLVVLSTIACKGIKETVVVAAIITIVEIGILIVIIVFGAPLVIDSGILGNSLVPSASWHSWSLIFSGAIVAFFAFMGFEDIVNMGDEAVDASRTTPLAIFFTLVVTLVLYVLISVVAVALPDRAELVASEAPLAYMFETISNRSGNVVSAVASIAMINGILVQLVMASRLLYGMSNDGAMPTWFAHVHPATQTPIRAILTVALTVGVASLTFPLVILAKTASIVLLMVFCLVNLSVWKLGGRQPVDSLLYRWRYWGLCALIPSTILLLAELARYLR